MYVSQWRFEPQDKYDFLYTAKTFSYEELLGTELKDFTLSGHPKDLQFPDTKTFRSYKECPENLWLMFFWWVNPKHTAYDTNLRS